MQGNVPDTVKTFFPTLEPTWPATMKPGDALNSIDQISILVGDMNKAIDYFGAAFGWGPFYVVEYNDKAGEHGELGEYHLILAFVQVGQIEVELIEWISGDTPHRAHLAEKGEGLFHLRLRTPDIEEALSHLDRQAIQPIWDTWIGGVMMSSCMDSHTKFGVRTELVRTPPQIKAVLERTGR
jgi:methylmalonyl-CoA/ethylmalonyl-CoA epimerase